VNLAGLSLNDQYFAAVNQTNTSLLQSGAAGIFGVGFPNNRSNVFVCSASEDSQGEISNIWTNFTANQPEVMKRLDEEDIRSSSGASLAARRSSELDDFYSSISSYPIHPRQQISSASALLASFSNFGPFLTRLSLAAPMFSILLQRDAIDIGGNLGQLSIGELPVGVMQGNLTWAEVRRYNQTEGGLAPPSDASDEVYPVQWEVPIDDVYFDGQKLPRSNLSSASISLTARVDTVSVFCHIYSNPL
jgi:hypothetical protein